MKTPIRYAGGKSKAYKIINEYINRLPPPKRIISPFIGGGSLESRWSSEMGIPVYGYDIFDALVNFWNVLIDNPGGLASSLEKIIPTKENYYRIKEILLQWEYTQQMLDGWATDYYKRKPIILDNLTAASYYYFNHNLSYGPMFLGWISKIYQSQKKWEKMIESVRIYKNKNLFVKKGTFENVIPNYKKDLLYLDPPYFLNDDPDNKMTKGLYPNSNIDVHHKGFNHELLRDILYSHNGSFILSYNNCKTIREYYSEFEFYYPEWHYSYASGETRVGANKMSRGVDHNKKKSHEIIIFKP